MKHILIIFYVFPAIAFAQTQLDTELILDQKLDAWHEAAAKADLNNYFALLADDAIYIGTDKTERWDRDSFYEFSKPYFDKGKAWDFTPYDRKIFISMDETSAWFSELLETHMGICRGSGVLTRIDNEWKLRQYHLSVTVPNEIISDFIELVNSFEKKEKN